MKGDHEPGLEQARKNRLVAIALICGAFACFACLDATAKWLNPKVGPVVATWARYVSSFFFVSLILNPWTHANLATTRKPGLQALRSAVLLCSTILNFIALQYLQLAQTITIMFLQPLLVALLAGPILGEWIGPKRLAAIGVGFLGVILVTRPGLGGIHWAAIYSFIGVGLYAAYAILTRILAHHDSSETTMFYSAAAGILVLSPIIPFYWQMPPDGLSWLLLLIIGFWGALGHWLLILAHRLAPAAILAPFLYTQILWMLGLGYLLFEDRPDALTLLGAGIVIGSGLYLLHREHQQKKPSSHVLNIDRTNF
jgi:drug/metabolite transporter (DMT)-like permease